MRFVLVVLLLAVTTARPTSAQRLPDVLASLRPHQTVRIRTLSHGVHVGRLLRVRADTVYLDPVQGATWVHVDAVDRLWVRATAGKPGAIIGAVVGGAVGGAMLAWVTYALCDTSDCAVRADAALVGGLVGAGTGAITGVVLGSFIGRWRQRYP